jgi:rare lipoprotein A
VRPTINQSGRRGQPGAGSQPSGCLSLSGMSGWRAVALAALVYGMACAAAAEPLPAGAPGARQEAERLNDLPPVQPGTAGHIDRSGRKQKGGASIYAHGFANKKMADGHRMDPNSNVAASKTLPLGSVARVTNLKNGKTATVRVEDRGPYVNGRVVDLAPKVADQLDLNKTGVAPAEVKPITLPRPDGGVNLGAGAADASRQEVERAVEVTKELTAPNLKK